MKIPTEPIGSIPRPGHLVEAMGAFSKGQIKENELAELTEQAIKENVNLFEQSPRTRHRTCGRETRETAKRELQLKEKRNHEI